MKKEKNAISVSRTENFNDWFQEVALELAEQSGVRGCMILKPWGYGIWELLQQELDRRFKETGHENAYFPIFIPLSYLEKESSHIDGFATECAVVTHHRLEAEDIEKDGVTKRVLKPTGELEEPLVVRPTSETVIGHAYSKWVNSYRDLPILINQWANVVRWEMRPRLLLRTAEFLWQEGHTAHATEQEATEEVHRMVDVYEDTLVNVLCLAPYVGSKPAFDRFPGALETVALECMMQDGKSVQCGTSHYLGTNFAKAFDISFTDRDGEVKLAHTTSWGVSTRLLGAILMSHGDDDGCRIPPKIAPYQVVIIPVLNGEGDEAVLEYCRKVKGHIAEVSREVRCHIDERDLSWSDKKWQWIRRGAPIRIEIGLRDVEAGKILLRRRDEGVRDKHILDLAELNVRDLLADIEQNLRKQVQESQEKSLKRATSKEELVDLASGEFMGFVAANWHPDAATETENLMKEHKFSLRCLPKNLQSPGQCIFTGKQTETVALFARSY